ncbi:4-carboxymuconolactone decarboxylase [Saxibacter everestensis]|uniref:bifunctional 3-oxoadipate enol-lactonase/4-carboxymuconolactone decarboxylase PcaDC n=1 Tax=Saxibacter everestensis TaxID=2909229 RepID=UPI0032E35EC6
MTTPPTLHFSLDPYTGPAAGSELLVLGPSLGTTAGLWSSSVGRLTDRFRVLRFDLPGHGRSPADGGPFDVADLAAAVLRAVDSVGGGRFHYAGVSLGGAIGLELAIRHGDRLLDLAVICSGARIGTAQSWAERAGQVRALGTTSLVTGSAERWFAPGFPERDNTTAAELLDRLVEVDDASYVACCEALGRFDVTAELSGIRVPTLFLAAECDEVTPTGQARQAAASVPCADVVELAGASHLAVAERPAEAARLLIDFFTRTGPDRGTATEGDPADDRYQAGMAVRRAVLGAAHVDRATANIIPETEDFQRFITRYAWGEVWTRPGLARRERSIVTLACLVGAGHYEELGMHIRAGLTNGLTRAEISEILLQTAIYASVPSANNAFRIAQAVYAELDADGPASDPDGAGSTTEPNSADNDGPRDTGRGEEGS